MTVQAVGHADPVVRVDRVPLLRGRLSLAEQVTFDVRAGHFVELQGANGAGKSTLLRLLAGVQPLTGGSVSLHGPIALFAAPFGLRRELTVIEQLRLSVSLYGVSLDLADCKAVLREVGLAHKALALTSHLSQGQRARLGLCILKASRARVWLMDEPVNALDAEGIGLLASMLVGHLKAGGCAVVATHQSLPGLEASLAVYLAGVVRIQGGKAYFEASLPTAGSGSANTHGSIVEAHENASPVSASQASDGGHSGCYQCSQAAPVAGPGWVLRREWTLFRAAPRAAVWPAVFHAMVLCLFPIGLGADVNLLMRVAAGLFWVSCLLACVLSAAPLFESDYNEGALAQMTAAGVSLPSVASGKIAVAWLTQGGALALVSGVLAMQYRLPGAEIGFLMLSLALGTGVLVHLSAFFGSMTLMARQSSMLVYLLALPLFVPVLVFGTSVLISVQGGQNPWWPLAVLGGLSLLCSLAIPWLVAQMLVWAME